ncbi:3-oxo-5-alpha-steroid 4-dehydrogenase [Metarhizium rileyi]|uniref:Polyprenal reductase n=1 Tax=Metarhizium rileyi (strain RCEF 4871) TaxID=1649241 RepID=A0A166W8L8_METRR|nr:3-oxo-5-alpha-steroid 4-dehydrogenase [Metarhizium rileyi RCEF 4871]TWU73629.1 hypothetical protein ED733_002660 [Metarhizium rileyi]
MGTFQALLDRLSTAPPSTYCQAFFLLAAAPIVALQFLPQDARSALADYGARRRHGVDSSLLGRVTAAGQLPHSYFWHFYLLSVGLSAFWAWQYFVRGSVLFLVADRQASLSGERSGDPGRVVLTWFMMAAQGGRRLYECFRVVKPGRTPMWFVHWALGLGFYSFMSVSVWVEASGGILESWQAPAVAVSWTWTSTFTLVLFLAAWLKQYECHAYLASLKKYTFPDKGMFKYIVCPHYTCECVIYLAISIMAAPPGKTFNVSVLCGLGLVLANLGSTAQGTKHWYAAKFGAEKVASKWSIIPGVL